MYNSNAIFYWKKMSGYLNCTYRDIDIIEIIISVVYISEYFITQKQKNLCNLINNII